MFVSTFTQEISKTPGVVPINITVGSKTSLSPFFVNNFICNYTALLGIGFMPIGVCHPPFTNFYCFGKVMKKKWYRQKSNLSLQPQIVWRLVTMTKSLVQ